MDATVNDFLKEINEIAPPKTKPQSKIAWKECYDESTGFAYYWNTHTDEVTWEMPNEYKAYREQNPKTPPKRKLFVPPKSEPLFPAGSLPTVREDTVKIYKINDKKQPKNFPKKDVKHNADVKKVSNTKKPSSESDDEKIVLISSYGGETESESEEEQPKLEIPNNKQLTAAGPHLSVKDIVVIASDRPANNVKNKTPSNISDVEDDDTDILTQIQNRAKVLKELGGELPEDVKKLVDDSSNPESVKFDKKDVTGFSLVAGYGEDSDEDDDEVKTVFPVKRSAPKSSVSHSTLFPITPSIDVKQFSSKMVEKPLNLEENVDVKAFQRKRRIGIDLVNTHKYRKVSDAPPPAEPSNERLGFGFKSGTEYAGFKSGGVMFVKSDVLNPPQPPDESSVENDDTKDHVSYVKDDKLVKEINDVQISLGEKLKFLCEGHNLALPVQVMIIQMETLYTAMKAHSLKPSYLKAWLKDTCEGLVKLEKEAAPSGWLLQWDRQHKRYYYHSQTTGESQWEYPQADIVGGDDAMDICTTPPPPNDEHSNDSLNMNMLVPPPPPRIKERSVTPPPPPVISGHKAKQLKAEKNTDDGEPLPPGVDAPEVGKLEANVNAKANKEATGNNDMLNSALDSFYSDLAAIETPSQPKPEETPKTDNLVTPALNEQLVSAQPTKKKKTKVKMAQGLAMKKKGVSKLVEKWKNVQKNYE